jgi:hypothetical protein
MSEQGLIIYHFFWSEKLLHFKLCTYITKSTLSVHFNLCPAYYCPVPFLLHFSNLKNFRSRVSKLQTSLLLMQNHDKCVKDLCYQDPFHFISLVHCLNLKIKLLNKYLTCIFMPRKEFFTQLRLFFKNNYGEINFLEIKNWYK